MLSRKIKTGFTLIELLVVIAIIGLLSSIVLISLNNARSKARDAKRIADFRQLSTAFELYYEKTGTEPSNFAGGGACTDGNGTLAAYNQSMQQLVTAGVLAAIPTSPGTQGYANGYCYFNYGPGSTGALMVTMLENGPATTTGIAPSCRPWGAGINWCDQSSNKYYCICNPY